MNFIFEQIFILFYLFVWLSSGELKPIDQWVECNKRKSGITLMANRRFSVVLRQGLSSLSRSHEPSESVFEPLVILGEYFEAPVSLLEPF